MATRLGLACLASSLAPDEGLAVFAELQRARYPQNSVADLDPYPGFFAMQIQVPDRVFFNFQFFNFYKLNLHTI